MLVLGVSGIAVSPTQIASAYRKLALELDNPRAPTVLSPVREGLRDSVRYGMANNAAIPGIDIAGKTGTSNDGGWFAGVGSFAQEQIVLVIHLPRGNGADAARLAQRFFLPSSTPESARSLTVELWAARSVTQLTATPLSTAAPIKVEWSQAGLRTSSVRTIKRLTLSGGFRMQAAGAQEAAVAAGNWTITWQPDGLRVLLTLPSENYVVAALNGEAAPDEPMASLKAMAISIRTFALLNANRHQCRRFWTLRQHPLPGTSPRQSSSGSGAGSAGDGRRNALVRRRAGARLLRPALRRYE